MSDTPTAPVVCDCPRKDSWHCDCPNLKPCPFCGAGQSIVTIYQDDYGYWSVGCGRCGSHSGKRPKSDPEGKQKVMVLWNSRPAEIA